MKSGIKIVESTGHGKAVAGTKRTSSFQVREYIHTGGYMLRGQFRFVCSNRMSKIAARWKAKEFAESL